jgi:four helix bundle protein
MSRKVERFEDLIAWQRAMDLAEHAYDISAGPKFARDFAFIDQMHRAALSIPSNVAEGFERGTRAEFHHFLSIAKASCAELRCQIYLARRVGYIDAQTESATLSEAESVARIIGKLRMTVGRQRGTPPMPHAACLMPEVE